MVFSWTNPLEIAVVLRSQLPPPDNEIIVEPGQTVKRNISVPGTTSLAIQTFDSITQQVLPINGKTVFMAKVVATYVRRVVTPGK